MRPDVPAGMPGPRIPMHTTDVYVIQLLVVQSAIARSRTAFTVASLGAKFAPVSVALAITVATLKGINAVMAGAVHRQAVNVCKMCVAGICCHRS